jgi:CBS domain-containing protein
MTCGELMTQSVAFCSQDDRVDLAAIMMRDRNVGALPVVEQHNRPVGMLTDRDLATSICANADDAFYKKVREIMRSPAVCCKESDDISAVMTTMVEHHIRRVPIIDGDGKLVGIISVDDLARSLDSETVRPLLAELSIRGVLKPTA